MGPSDLGTGRENLNGTARPGHRERKPTLLLFFFLKKVCVHAKLLQSCKTLCDLIDSSLPGFYVHGIFQARILEWVAISFSRGSS